MKQTQYFPEIIPFREGQKWGYTDRDKKFLIDPQYDQGFRFVGEIAKVKVGDKFGIIRKDGSTLLPAEYDEIGNDYDGAFCNEDGSTSMYKDGKTGLIASTGDILAPAIFETEAEAHSVAKANGWQGGVPANFYPDIPAASLIGIQAIKTFRNGVAPFKQDNKWGLIDQQGTIIAKPQFDQIKDQENENWPFCFEGKWGLLTAEGEILIEARFEDSRGMYNGQAACMQNGLWGAVDSNGEWVVQPQFTELGIFQDGLSAAQKNGLYGFIDETGNTVLDFQYGGVLDFYEGACAIFDKDYHHLYFINSQGQKISEQYLRMAGPHEEGHVIQVYEGDKWGVVKPNGEFLLPIEYDLPKAMGQIVHNFTMGMIPIKKGPLLGYANMKGEQIVDPKYMSVHEYHEGMSLVSTLHPSLNFGATPQSIEDSGSISGVFNFGFLDMTGKELVTPKYILARRFDYGLAFVETNDFQAGFITYDGTEYFEG